MQLHIVVQISWRLLLVGRVRFKDKVQLSVHCVRAGDLVQIAIMSLELQVTAQVEFWSVWVSGRLASWI